MAKLSSYPAHLLVWWLYKQRLIPKYCKCTKCTYTPSNIANFSWWSFDSIFCIVHMSCGGLRNIRRFFETRKCSCNRIVIICILIPHPARYPWQSLTIKCIYENPPHPPTTKNAHLCFYFSNVKECNTDLLNEIVSTSSFWERFVYAKNLYSSGIIKNNKQMHTQKCVVGDSISHQGAVIFITQNLLHFLLMRNKIWHRPINNYFD